jgi:glutamine synthetase
LETQDRLVFVGTSDLSGILRGKSFPLSQWEKRICCGLGWTPTNVQITCFDTLAESPFGSFGDLALVPDPATHITLQQPNNVFDFVLGNICTLDGTPWSYCTRSIAHRAIENLYKTCGATTFAAFEHEFQIKNMLSQAGDSFGLKGFRDAKEWSANFMVALAQSGCKPDSFMKEYGPSQYEVTIKPTAGLTAPDQAVVLRALANDVIRSHGAAPSFSPILDPASVGNGVHIHFSFINDAGSPLTYDPDNPHGMSELTRHFIGGILRYLDQIMALLAPSEISYLRLTPHRWSAAFNNLGYRDREAAVRICPVSKQSLEKISKQFNFEVRALDAAASPHLAYAALVFAGTQGVKDRIEPPAPTEQDLSLLSEDDLAASDFQRLPQSLPEALERLNSSCAARDWFGDDFIDVYIAHKRGEMEVLSGLDWTEKCALYKDVY